jgi:F0F1-type ATP synthase assembly protein I
MTEPSAPLPDRLKERVASAKETGSASAIGLEFGLSIAIGAIGGRWLDNWFGTEPWCLAAGVLFGSVAAFRSLYRFARKMSQKGS